VDRAFEAVGLENTLVQALSVVKKEEVPLLLAFLRNKRLKFL